jgi:type VI secretion system secreted protein VgrG
MSLPISQEKRPLTAKMPSGAERLVPVSLVGEEEVSKPFLFTVDFVSDNDSVQASSVLGKPVTLFLALTSAKPRPVHGIVRRFTSLGKQRELSRYRAEIVPGLWFLSLSSDCRTFENESALDIVEAVCKGAGVTDMKRRVAAPPKPLPYVVQYRETDLAFVSRMLEEAGLYYMFEHTNDKHVLVFSDAQAGTVPAGTVPEVKLRGATVEGLPQEDAVIEFARDFVVHAAGVSLADHDLLRADNKGSASSKSPGARGTRFDFLGDLGPNDSEAEAKRRIEIEEAVRDVARGASTCAGFQAGTRVKLKEGVLKGGAEFHLLRVSHRLEIGDVVAGSDLESRYENEFVAIPAASRFRPPRVTPRPCVRGTQSAIIVGAGEAGQIDVDAAGCVLLQFPWDRGKGKEGKSQHRVHVASVWAGTAWGFVQHPRKGQEVLVEFLEGDPERPIVTGRVYDSSHKPPYTLPGNKTQSGWKSRTVDGGADNFNELRFEDKKGSEHVFAQAEKDLQVKVKNDETRDVLHDRTTTIKNNDTRTVQEGNDAHTVSKGNQTVEVTEGDQTVKVVKGKQTVTVHDDQTITVEQGKRVVTLQQGNDTLSVKLGNLTIEVDSGNISIKAKAGKIALEAVQSIEMKVGASTVKLDPASIAMKSTMVSIEGQAKADVKSPMLTLEGQGQATLKGAMVTVQGQGMTQVKAPMTQVNGDGLLMAKGGITMIN